MGKSSINGPFSMAMLNNQRVYISAVIPINTHFRCATPGPWSRPGIPCCRSSPATALLRNVLIGVSTRGKNGWTKWIWKKKVDFHEWWYDMI